MPFSISVSAYDDYKKQTVYSPSRIDLEISNLCPIGVDNGDGTCTVVLQSIGDAGVWGADFGTWSDDNFGSGFQFWTLDDSQVLYSGRMRSYLKFDVSSLQGLENDITDAGITLTVYQNFGGGRLDLDVGVYQVYDDSWTEGTITFNNQPCGNNRNIDNSVNCNLNVIDVDHSRGSFINGGDKFMSWNVLPTVINEVGLRDQEISFVFVDLLGDARTNFFSKETTYSIYRPKLTVTYTK